jgi:SAM-dependent methyltransferase
MEVQKIDSTGDGLDLPKLMEQIRTDAEERKRNSLKNGVSLFYRQLLTQAFDVLLPSSPEPPEHLLLPDLKLQPEFEQRDQYHVNDLLGFHDDQFVRNAYRAILRREPDDAGLAQYLGKLRSGRYSKIDILADLKFSPEGRSANVEIKGLTNSSAFRKLYRVPVLGYFLELAVAIIRLPVLIANHRQLESHAAAQLDRLASHINEAVATVSDLEYKQSERSRKQYDAFQEQMDDVKHAVSSQMDQLEKRIDGILDRLQSSRIELAQREMRLVLPFDGAPVPSRGESHVDLDSLYWSLEEGLRGTPEQIKQDAKVYLPVLEKAGVTSGILDVGCGRGEWLEVLKEAGLEAKGIDNNRLQVQHCRSLSLDVVESEALAYLASVEDASLNAITAFHFAEHLPLETLVRLLDEAARTLKPGGLLILETPNPENLLVGSCNFYLDPSHNKPIPIPTMRLLVEARGFHCQEIMKLHPVPNVQIEVVDQLTSHVNHFLYGPMNYAVVARKPGSERP